MEKEISFILKDDKVRLKIYENGRKGPVILYVTMPHSTENTKVIFDNLSGRLKNDFVLAELTVKDWDRFLTPWPVADCMKNRNFTGEGSSLLTVITGDALPYIEQVYPEHGSFYIAGYSLAGLFSLWAFYEEECFKGAASASGSLWYPGWTKYCQGKSINSDKDPLIYLSLGDRESKSRNPLMKQVLDATELQYQIFRDNDRIRSTFKMEQGGHFDDVDSRIANAVEWLLTEDKNIYDKSNRLQPNI